MNSKLNLTLKYALAIEVFFIAICALLVAIEYVIGSGVFTLKGTLACLAVFQIPVAFLAIKHWIRLSKDPFLN
jgi:hypothetical protein